MLTLSVIITASQQEKLNQTLDSLSAQLPQGTQLLCVAPNPAALTVPEGVALVSGSLWQAGLDGATGDYVQFLRAGETVPAYALAAALNKAERYEADCLRGCCLPLKDENTVLDLPEYTLSQLDPGSLHLSLKVKKASPLLDLAPAPEAWLFRRSFLTEHHLCPDQGASVFFWRSLCCSPRTVLTRDMLCTTAVPEEKTLEAGLEELSAVEAALRADGVEEETLALVVRRLLTVVFEQYAKESPAALVQWIEAYHGVCNDEIEAMWRAFRNAEPKEEPQPVKELPLRRGRSKKVKVSVILPIYNVEEYLNQALYSLSVQSLQEMEFLCVNDGSTDSSMTILQQYAAMDERFVILDGPNGGYGKAMNRGLDAAQGEYVGILEPDDYVSPGMYKKLYQTASKEELDFVKSNYFRFYVTEDGEAKQKRMYISREEEWYDRVIDPTQEQAAFHLPMKTWNGIYRRSFLNENGIRHHETPGASYQDNGFWFQTMCKAHRVEFLHNTFYHYRQDNPNSSINNTAKLYCMTEEYDFIRSWLEQQGLWEQFGGIYQAKKYHNFSTTYRRIAEEYRREYLHHIRDQFGPVGAAGGLKEECFEPLFWKQLNEILDDPDAWFDKIRVSVILPVYNCEAYLAQCLDSILQRNDQHIEVICVDDGSTDGSPAILADYQARDSRVRVFTQANAGAGAARNRGMLEARGEYLSFLDSDDFFDPEMLRKAYNKAYVDDSDIVVFRSQEYYEDTGEYLPMRSNIREQYLPEHTPFAGTDVPENIFRLFVGWAWDKLFRADFVRENGLRFQEQRTTNDLLFTYSAVVKAQRISTINSVLAYHRKASGSLSVTREQSWDCFYQALVALRQQLKDWNLYERFERDFVNYSLHFALWNMDTLRGEAYEKLYGKLVNEWLEDLEITCHGRRYFYAVDQYDRMEHMLRSTPETFLFDRMDDTVWELEAVKRERNRALRKTASLEGKIKEQKEQMAAQREKNAAQREQISGLRKQLKEARRQNRSFVEKVTGKLGRLLGR